MAARLIPGSWNLPEKIISRLGQEAGPQRAIFEDGHLLLVLHEPPQPGLAERKAVFFWRDDQGHWPSTAGRDSTAALRAHLAAYASRLHLLDGAEASADSARDYREVLKALVPLARAVRRMSAALQEARRLIPRDRELIDCRDSAAALERQAELLTQNAHHGLSFTVAQRSEEEAHAARRLNILAAVFLPLTTLCAIFGMNVKSGIESRPTAFWEVLVAGIGLGAFLIWVVGRRRRDQ